MKKIPKIGKNQFKEIEWRKCRYAITSGHLKDMFIAEIYWKRDVNGHMCKFYLGSKIKYYKEMEQTIEDCQKWAQEELVRYAMLFLKEEYQS